MKISSRRFHLSAVLAASLLAFPLSAHAQNFTILEDTAESGGFDITAEETKLPVEWSLNQQENGDGYRLRLTPNSAELNIQSGGKSTPLASAKTSVAAGAMTIQRRGPRWIVLAGSRIVLQAEDDKWMEGKIGYRGGEVKVARLQPVEEIAFDDDFMRVAKEVAFTAAVKANPTTGVNIKSADKGAETIWHPVLGTWATTGVSEQEQAMVAQSANPFGFVAKSKGRNMALAGRPFWSDYSVEASVKPQNSTSVGLAIYVQDAQNYLLFEWQRKGALSISSVAKGVSKIIATAQNDGFDDKNWYRLKFFVSAGTLRAFVDDEEVLRARTDLFGRGQIGLFASSLEESSDAVENAIFDDLRVRSSDDFYDDFSSVVAGRWQNVAGGWKMTIAATPVGVKGAFTVMGESDWSDYTASADVVLPSDSVAGLVAHHLKGEGAYIFRVAASQSKLPYAGKAQIVKIGGGKSTTLAETTVGKKFDGTSGHWSFAIENGYLQGSIELNGKSTRVVDAWNETNDGGRAGLYAQKGAKGTPVLKNFAVEFPRQTSRWAPVPDIYEDPLQAQTMGTWSTPEGLWMPTNPLKVSTPVVPAAGTAKPPETKTFWHKGAFWGDQDIRFKLPAMKPDQSLTLILGNETLQQSRSTPPLVLVLKTDGTNLMATLTRGEGEKLKDATRKIEGALENQPIEISRRGSFVIVRVGDEDNQSTLLAAKIVG